MFNSTVVINNTSAKPNLIQQSRITPNRFTGVFPGESKGRNLKFDLRLESIRGATKHSNELSTDANLKSIESRTQKNYLFQKARDRFDVIIRLRHLTDTIAA